MKHKEVSYEALERINISLQKRYNSLSESVERHEHYKDECRGGYRFASLIETVRESTKNREATSEAWKTLYEIAEHPSAGSISWEMRRFIRRAPPELLPEFFQVVREYAKVAKDYCFIDMDFFYWDADYGRNNRARETLENMKLSLERAKQPRA